MTLEDQLNRVNYVDFDYESKGTLFDFARQAEAFEQHSQHETYKVCSIIFGVDSGGRTFFIPTVNTIPPIIQKQLGPITSIGAGHPSVHAEFLGIELLPRFQRISFVMSRSVCPTCEEAISVLHNFKPKDGKVDAIYFNSRSLSGQDEMSKRSTQKWKISRKMLVRIAKQGRIQFSLVNPNAERVTSRYKLEKEERPFAPMENPIAFDVMDIDVFEDFNHAAVLGEAEIIAHRSTLEDNEEAAIVVGQRKSDGRWVKISASASLPPGFTYAEDQLLLDSDREREKRSYNYRMSALKLALVAAIKEGVDLETGAAYCTTVPISGMMINAVSYGIKTIITPFMDLDEDNPDHDALKLLSESNIITHRMIEPEAPFKGPSPIIL